MNKIIVSIVFAVILKRTDVTLAQYHQHSEDYEDWNHVKGLGALPNFWDLFSDSPQVTTSGWYHSLLVMGNVCFCCKNNSPP